MTPANDNPSRRARPARSLDDAFDQLLAQAALVVLVKKLRGQWSWARRERLP